MHFNNQTEGKNDDRDLLAEDMAVNKIEKETEDTKHVNDQTKNETKEEEQTDVEQKSVVEETITEPEEEKKKETSLTDEEVKSGKPEEEKSEESEKVTEQPEPEEEETKQEPVEEGKEEQKEPSAEQETEEPQESEEKPSIETEEGEKIEVEKETAPQEEKAAKEKKSSPKEPETKEEAELAKEMAQYEETFRDYKPGEIIEGTIVGFNDKEVLVDISYKSEGSIPISDFSNTDDIEINSTVKVYINKVENREGKVSLSKKIADFHLALDDIKEMYKNNETVNGVIKQRVKGGMIAEIKGLNAFLPGSQISIKPIPNLDQFIGKDVKFKIINIDESKKNIIVSRKKVLEKEQQEKIGKLREKLEVGAELDGEVKNITEYGAFIDLGGIDGLLHITDMSWGHIKHPSEMLNIGDKVKVKVIDYDENESRVSLGLKQLVPHPWENVELKYEEGIKVSGKVVNITPYGVFVELEPGVEGLVHISEMSWTKKISNPRHILNVGDTVNAIVLSVSKEEQKISLGMKQMEPNPWLVIDERYPVGTFIKGKIKSLTSFGAFVEIEEDIDGLIHISDISWTKRIYHPKEVLKKGQEVEAVVLSVDKHLHRIALGLKQLTPDPWEDLDQKLPINSEITGTITKIIPKGVLVEIDVDGDPIEGFVPISHLAIPRLDRPEKAFKVGDEIPMKVIELDMENRRLILSIKAYFFSKEREALQEFLKKHEPEMRQKSRQDEIRVMEEKPEELEAEKEIEPEEKEEGLEGSAEEEEMPSGEETEKEEPSAISETEAEKAEDQQVKAEEPEADEPKAEEPEEETEQKKEPETSVEEAAAEEEETSTDEETEKEEPSAISEAEAEKTEDEEVKVEEPEADESKAEEPVEETEQKKEPEPSVEEATAIEAEAGEEEESAPEPEKTTEDPDSEEEKKSKKATRPEEKKEKQEEPVS